MISTKLQCRNISIQCIQENKYILFYYICFVTKYVIFLTIHFWVAFQVTLCSHYFCDFQKKALDPNGPYTSTFQKNLKNVSLSVILEFCMQRVYRPHQVIQRPEMFTKSKVYFVINYPNVARYLIFQPLCLGKKKTLPYV